MGSIGDRLGLDLGELFGGEGEAPPDETSSPQSKNAQRASSAGAGPEEMVVELAAQLLGCPAGSIDFDAPLAELDLVGLPMWALVAELERQSRLSFDDEAVNGWGTLRDIASAMREGPRTAE